MNTRTLLILFALTLIFSGIVTVFWHQEARYKLPTPVPENYQHVAIGSQIDMDAFTGANTGKPTMLHFFNQDCPCSRFNIDHIRRLVKKYNQRINFYAVLQVEDESGAAESFDKKYRLNVPVIVDSHRKLAVACGVYATPQAALIGQNGSLYYRGNYNKARYCTSPDSNFAQMAADSLLAGKQPPVFIELATRSYGCALPENSLKASLLNIND